MIILSNKRNKNKRGVAIVSVILFCTVLVIMLSFLFINTKTKRSTQEFQYDTTRALMAANTAVQLAIYKYRVLSSDYYKINELELSLRAEKKDLNDPHLVYCKNIWLSDLCTKVKVDIDSESGENPYNKTASKIKRNFDHFSEEGENYNFGVSSFELVSLEKNGYTKDYIKIKAWGTYRHTRKDVEELIEVSIVR